jgi:hypothetical protein
MLRKKKLDKQLLQTAEEENQRAVEDRKVKAAAEKEKEKLVAEAARAEVAKAVAVERVAKLVEEEAKKLPRQLEWQKR